MDAILLIVVLIFSVVVHEVAHAWQARREGDDTAERLGRITLNPVPHLDLIGSFMVPLLLYFSAQRLPVRVGQAGPREPGQLPGPEVGRHPRVAGGHRLEPRVWRCCPRCRRGRRAQAGDRGRAPWGASPTRSVQMAAYGIIINLILAFFNLIPIPPLDGSHVLFHLLPRPAGAPVPRGGALRPPGLMALLFLLPGAFNVLLWPVTGSWASPTPSSACGSDRRRGPGPARRASSSSRSIASRARWTSCCTSSARRTSTSSTSPSRRSPTSSCRPSGGSRPTTWTRPGEFLEMAATLVRIKAQMLLPRSEEEEDEDPRAELVRRLLEYEQIREISQRLSAAEADRARRFGKGYNPPRPRRPVADTPAGDHVGRGLRGRAGGRDARARARAAPGDPADGGHGGQDRPDPRRAAGEHARRVQQPAAGLPGEDARRDDLPGRTGADPAPPPLPPADQPVRRAVDLPPGGGRPGARGAGGRGGPRAGARGSEHEAVHEEEGAAPA